MQQHANGVDEKATYLVNFALPHSVGVSGVVASEFAGSQAIDALIGMDVIGLGDLAITHVGGRTCMSFRMPSHGTIDYVKEFNAILFRGVGRNAPCPCGANKKFKFCHGAGLNS